MLNAIRSSYGSLRILKGLSGIINLFCKKFSRTENQAKRDQLLLPQGLLNGQDLEPLAELPYGAWKIGNNGCEAIAVYNALLSIGVSASFQEVTAALEENGLLFNGFGGTNLASVVKYLRKNGLSPKVLRRHSSLAYDDAFSNVECAILSFWTGKSLKRKDGSWNTLHTVAVRHCPQGIEVYNAWGNRPFPCVASSFHEFLGQDLQPVCLILLGKEIKVDKKFRS